MRIATAAIKIFPRIELNPTRRRYLAAVIGDKPRDEIKFRVQKSLLLDTIKKILTYILDITKTARIAYFQNDLRYQANRVLNKYRL